MGLPGKGSAVTSNGERSGTSRQLAKMVERLKSKVICQVSKLSLLVASHC